STDNNEYVYYLRDLSYIPESKWMHYVPETMIAFVKPTLEYISFTYKMFVHISLSFLMDPFSQPLNFLIMSACVVFVVMILFPLNIILTFAKKLFNNPHM